MDSKKFQEFKKIVQEGVKKSWDDMLIPTLAEEPEQSSRKKDKKKKKQESKEA